ncbi:MAG: tetratricopeptide repeat protein, partial [Planctomycetota bacterium]
SRLAALEARRKAAEAQAKAAEAEAKTEAARAAAEKEKAKAERARQQAERAAAEADRSHKTRKQTRRLAGAVVTLVLAGAVVFWFVDKGNRERAAATTAQVNDAMEDANLLLGEGQYSEAALAARQAAELGGGGEAQALIEQIEEEAAAATAAAKRRKEQLAFVARLEDIRLRGAHASYGAAFKASGTGLAAKSIRAIPEWRDIVGAVDAWAWGEPRMVALAKAADPHAVRNALRDSHVVPQPLPEKPDARTAVLIARALEESGDRDATIAFLRRTRARHPDDLWVNHRLACALARDGSHAEAARYLVGALALRPESSTIRCQLSAALCRAGDAEAAVAAARDAGGDPIARAHLAAALVCAGERAEGERVYRAALAESADKAGVHATFGRAAGSIAALRLAGSAHLGLGLALYASGDFAGAAEELAKEPGRYDAQLVLGAALDRLGRYEEAETAHRACLKERPRDWQAHANLADGLRRQGRYADARAAAKRAAELSPTRARTQVLLGDIARDEGEPRDAAKAYYQAIRLGDDAAQADLAAMQLALDDLEQAEVSIREAMRAVPARATLILARLRLRQGDFRAAEKACTDPRARMFLALAVARANPDAALALLDGMDKSPLVERAKGELLVHLDPDAAIETLRAGLELEFGRRHDARFTYGVANHKALTWLALGRAHLRKGEFEKAAEAFAKSDELGTSGPFWTAPTSDLVDMCKELRDPRDDFTRAHRAFVDRKWKESLALFEKAFAAGHEGGRLVAARAAAQAGDRAKALAWLQAGLKELEPDLTDIDVDDRRNARDTLLELSLLPEFRAYRIEPLLQRIPEPERGEWRAFWVELQLVLSKPRPLR